MGDKLLTVSIAAYNVSEFIRETLDSLLLDREHMRLLEVIIVNDGSTDDTLETAKEYSRQYPETFRVIDKKNGGYGSTINASLAEAGGRYYRLLDGDDRADPDALGALLDYLKTADADLVVSPYSIVKGEKIPVPHHPDIPEKKTSLSSLRLKDKLFQMHGLTVKTETLRRYGHPVTEHCFYTDIEYVYYCLASSETIVRFDSPVYNYRMDVDGQSVSLAGIRKHYKDHPVVTERICSCFENERFGSADGKPGNDNPGSGDGKQEILSYAVTFSIYGVFNNYMVLEDAGKHKKELMAFDERLAEKYPHAYSAGNDSSVVKTLRRSGFHLYGPMCRYMKFKFGRF